MRTLCLLAFGSLVGLIAYTYNLKIKTRALEARAHELTAALQDESDLLALMRAETSHLSRPDRIEELARKTLGFEPLSNAQLVPWSAVASDRPSRWQPQIALMPRKQGIAALIERAIPPSGPQAR